MSMQCANCGVSVMKKPLTRVNPKGEIGIFWCWDCLKKNEPELYKNEKEDKPKVVNDLENILYDK